jgi:hypothetical protein
MAYFQTKNPNLGQFWSALDWKLLIYFMDICNILWTLGIFYVCMTTWDILHMTIWYMLCSFDTFFPVSVSCTKKNLATLMLSTYFLELVLLFLELLKCVTNFPIKKKCRFWKHFRRKRTLIIYFSFHFFGGQLVVRVTRLGKFLTDWLLFTLGRFLKIKKKFPHSFELAFSKVKVMHRFWQIRLGLNFGWCFHNLIRGPFLTSPRPWGKLWPPGAKLSARGEFVPLGLSYPPWGEILCLPLHSSKQ